MGKRKKSGKGKIIAKVVAIVVFLIVLYLMIPTINGFINSPPSMEYYTIPKEMTFKFERIITINAQGNYTFNITVPQNNQFQKVKVDDLSSMPKNVVNEYNRTVWSYPLKNNAQIKLVYEGKVVAKVWHINNSLDVNAIPESLKKQYNHNESLTFYNSDEHTYVKEIVINPYAFKNVTEKLTQNDTNVLEKLRTIYNVIVDNFHYISERKGIPNSAVKTWNQGAGDCDELSFVFVSMARSIGIPAWVEYGLVYTQNSWSPHAWIGAVVPTKNGIVKVNIDTTVEVGKQNYGLGFLIRYADRLTEWQDDGNSQHLNSYYTLIKGYYEHLTYQERVNIFYANQTGKISIPVGGTQIPQWLMMIIVAIIIIGVFVAIIKI
jgi:hypothetical protein